MTWQQSIARVLIRFGYRVLKVDMVGAAHRLVGIDMGPSFDTSSEKLILKRIVFQNLATNSIVLDIGANKGDYSEMLIKHFDKGSIHSFEPNPACSRILKNKLQNSVHEIALGSKSGNVTFFHYKDDLESQHGSIVKGAMRQDKEIAEVPVQLMRLDDFLRETKLSTPSFVKIDTEGNDLEVIKGMGAYKSDIQFIQFEFNDMYVASRVFLKDFYEELPEFKLYRIGRKGLVDISTYSRHYEIFRYQNILAVNNSLDIDLPIEF